MNHKNIGLEDIYNVTSQSRLLYDEAALSAIYDRMAHEITNDLSQTMPIVLCVMNGGLIATGELLRRIDFPLELDYAHATRYHGGTHGGEMEWIRFPEDRVEGRDILIIDDILDVGITMKMLQERCMQSGAKSVKSAVLAIKQHDRRVQGVEVDYFGLTVEDSYVYGCGMDYHGYFRNLNGIYALETNDKESL